MLSHIYVKDLAIVSSLELDLGQGMTALTGETGAGKSILIDALGLTLGDKADAGLIRAGCERAEVVAGFDVQDIPAARTWLADQGLDESGECLVRRLLVRSGRSRAYINSRPATGSQLQELGELLVDIHGQHAHQSLLRAAGQRELLDAYAGLTERAAEVARLFRTYRALEERVRTLTAERAERSARLELLRLEVGELEALGLTGEEMEELDREHRRLANLGALQQTSGRLLERLYDGEPSVHAELAQALGELDELLGFDQRIAQIRELVEGAAIQLEEAASSLRQYLDGLDLDPSLMDQVETRLAQVHDLARKFRVFPQQLPDRLMHLQEELAALERDHVAVDALAEERDAARKAFLEEASELSGRRSNCPPRRRGLRRESWSGQGRAAGQRQSGPAPAAAGQGRLRRRALAHQPLYTGRRGPVRGDTHPGLRRGRCGYRRRGGGNCRTAPANTGRVPSSALRHPSATSGSPSGRAPAGPKASP
jgi:DNA repair protein RecN (Recombination protein N)